jgi:hypothetical protein
MKNVKILLVSVAIVGIVICTFVGWQYYNEKRKISFALDQLSSLLQEWAPATKLAASTPKLTLAFPLQRMQDIRMQVKNLSVNGCAETVKQEILTHMDYTIEFFFNFMSGKNEISPIATATYELNNKLMVIHFKDCMDEADKALDKFAL